MVLNRNNEGFVARKTQGGSAVSQPGKRRSGGQSAFSQEFERHYRQNYAAVYNFVFYKMLDAHAAEEVTAEAFLKAARYFDRFDASRAQFGTWAKSIARNCVVDYYRKNKAKVSIDDVSESVFAVDEKRIEAVANADYVRELLKVLEDEERELVFLKYYEGKGNSQIAADLNMNPSTVATKLQRALAKMRKAAERSS